MNKKSVGNFLKKNNAIFSYIKDDNGNRIGTIIAVPGENEPKIGFAFFDEVVNVENIDECYKTITELKDLPNFIKQLSHYGIYEKDIKNLKLPGLSSGYFRIVKFRPEYIDRLATLALARKRANTFRPRFYVDLNDEYQGSSCIYNEDGATVVYGKRKSPYRGMNRLETPYYASPNNFITANCLRKQIKQFEYRALKYYKYISGYKSKSTNS